MNWLDFKNAVKELLTVDKNRQGMGTYIDTIIRVAVVDLQNNIPAFRVNHETLYLPGDFVQEGAAGRAVLPPQAALRDCFMSKVFTDGSSERHPVNQYPWDDRFALVHGTAAVNDSAGLICIDPNSYTFYAYPYMVTGWILSVFWDGQKLDFQDAEETPFTENETFCVSLYVKAMIAREVNRDMDAFAAYMGKGGDPIQSPPGTYIGERRKLMLAANERGNLQ